MKEHVDSLLGKSKTAEISSVKNYKLNWKEAKKIYRQ